MEEKIVILILGQVPDVDCSLRHVLDSSSLKLEIHTLAFEADLVSGISRLQPHLILAGYSPDFSRVTRAFHRLQQSGSFLPFLCVIDANQEDQAFALLEAGATDYVFREKPEQLSLRLRRALSNQSISVRAASTVNGTESEQLRRILELSRDLIVVTNQGGQCLLVSAAVQPLLGYTPEEFISLAPLAVVSPQDKDKTVQALAGIMQGEEVVNFENRLVHKDGRLITIWWSAQWSPQDQMIYGIGRDMTAYMVQDNQVRNSEKRLRALLENSNDAYTLLSADARVLERSASAYRVLGDLAGAEYGKFRLDLVHPKEVPRVQATLYRVKEEPNSTVTIEYRFRQPDDTYKWLEVSFCNQLQEPAVGAIVLNYRDITDRKRSELTLRESENRLNQAQALGKIGHWEMNLADGKVQWSDELYRMFGLLPGDAAPSFEAYMAFMHPEDRPLVTARFQQLQPSTEVNASSYRIIRKDGELRYMHALSYFELNQHQQPERLFGVIQDVTDLKQAEQALEKSEQKYRALFDFSPSPMWVYDVESLRFVEVNEAAVQRYGYSKADFLSMTMLNIVPQEDLKPFREILNIYKGTNKIYRGIRKHLKHDGEIIEVDIQCTSIIRNGREVRIVVATDISERLQHMREIEKQNARLREIAWTQSHVVRAPLARIMGLINLLEDESWKSTEEYDILDLIKASAQELDDIIRKIIKGTESSEGRKE